jgi:TonB-dependent receptor
MKTRRGIPRKRALVSALLLALGQGAYAQDATQPQPETGTQDAPQQTRTSPLQPDDPTELDAVVVTGIRGSLISSMNLKRNAQGVVDGIVAEDIGKFPDTNLAESLQRISGVSIDRTSSGEGSRVTVRGVGPDYNMVLLNGRQMPASTLLDTGASASRAFDFANLASEAISEIEVYKTSRASTPAGGIGATINIKTARPLDNPGFHGSVGAKAVYDTSNDNLPDSLAGDSVTPELSGIFSATSADGRFGIGVSGSYQERDSGFNQVCVCNGWRTFQGDDTNNWGTIPTPGEPGYENITNPPGPGDVYSVPQNLNYNINGIHRERTNGQVVLQWAPTDRLTTTLDYTYSENKIQQRRNDMSVWFNFGPSVSSWTDGPVAAPDSYSEIIVPATSDLAMGGAEFATKTQNKSLGFNAEWQATDNLSLVFDAHKSTAESGADSPWGSNAVLGTAAFIRGTTTADFSGDFPIVSIQYPPGMTQPDPAGVMVTGSSFRNSYMKAEVDQYQLSGAFQFEGYSKLDFGVSSTEVNNRSAYSNVQLDTWGGATNAGDYPDEVWQLDHMGNYFDAFSGHNDPNFTDAFFLWDFETVRQLAEDAWAAAGNNPADYRASDNFTTDRRTTEKSRSAYLQWSNTWDWSMPLNVAVGVRYEKTEVDSRALVPTAVGISWQANNEFTVLTEGSEFTSLRGEYDYWLPNLDASLELTDEMVLRASYGQSIGRPLWDQIQGGRTLDALARVDGGTGAQGNPNLRPLLSDNFDVSFEWYYDDASFVSVGWFRKNIDNYIGTTQVVDTPFDLHTPVGGAYWNEAIAAGCTTADVTCIRNFIFLNHDGDPGVTRGPDDVNGNQTGTIVGQPGDPLAEFRITTPANQKSASLDGWEFNVQHMFGDSGFGLSANYTIVDSSLTYDNQIIGEQFALVGLSDSANLVAFYEKYGWSVRAAYNWRDKFLQSTFDGTGPNPIYVEAYGQLDLSVGYEINERLSLQFEAINLTDETQRLHSRHENQLEFATQTGPRYMIGARYKF